MQISKITETPKKGDLVTHCDDNNVPSKFEDLCFSKNYINLKNHTFYIDKVTELPYSSTIKLFADKDIHWYLDGKFYLVTLTEEERIILTLKGILT